MTNRLADSRSPNKRMQVGDISLVLTRSTSPATLLLRNFWKISLKTLASNSPRLEFCCKVTVAPWLPASVKLDCEPQTSISAQRRFSNIAPWPTHSLISDPKLRKRPFDLCLEELNILISQMCVLNAYVLSHDWPLTRLQIQYWPSSPLCPSCHLNHPPSLDLLISIHFGRNTCTN